MAEGSLVSEQNQDNFTRRVIKYLKDSGWRCIDIRHTHIKPASLSNSYTFFPDYVGGPVVGTPFGEALSRQIKRDFDTGKLNRLAAYLEEGSEG